MRQTIGQQVRAAREARGLTVGAAADAAGIAKAYLSMIENHRVAPPSQRVLVAIATALGMDEQQLLAAAQWESAPPLVKQTVVRQAQAVDQAQDLARWLLESTSRKAGGGRNLDRLFRSGQLRKRVAATLDEIDTGEGEVLLPGAEPRTTGDFGGPVPGSSASHSHMAVMAVAGWRIPLINKVAAGYPTDFTDLGYPARAADEHIGCPDVGDPDAFAARVVGESMLPDYREGDVVVFSPAADVVDGCDCFVRLEPDHESTFKRIYFDGPQQDRIRLVPLNATFTPKTYDREQVAGLYRAVWSLRRV